MLKVDTFWECIDILYSYKANDIISYNGKKLSERIVVSSCESSRQVKAIASGLIKHCKKEGMSYSSEGMEEGHWVLIDLEGIMFHIFRHDVRNYYDIDNFLNNSD